MKVTLRRQDAELLALMADTDNPYSTVYYVPGREHDTNSEARTRYSFQRYQPATAGLKSFVRVTAPVNRLVAAGLVEHASADSRCQVTLTDAGRAYLARTKAPALEDVKDGDIITYREFSLRSEKVVTRRARVYGCYIHQGTLRFEGSYVKKDGTRAAVQPRFGLYATVAPRELVAINA
jgi:hypothetical protein